jgi:TRAP-type mannitol/chloroaromatic compound transport system permease small subunit
MSKTERVTELLKLPTTWLGILLIAVAFTVLIRQPIQASRWYWTEIWNYVTALLIVIPAGFSIALSIARIVKNERQRMEQKSDET